MCCTWWPPSAAVAGAGGSPSLPFLPRTRVSCLPTPCAEHPGFFSFVHDAVEANNRTEDAVSTLD